MIKLSQWFKSPLKIREKAKDLFHGQIVITEKEDKLLVACELILSREDRDIKINPDDMSYIIHSSELSYYIHVNSTSISFSNHDFLVTKNYTERFIDLVKEKIRTKTILDRNALLETISENENNLLDKMIQDLKTK